MWRSGGERRGERARALARGSRQATAREATEKSSLGVCTRESRSTARQRLATSRHLSLPAAAGSGAGGTRQVWNCRLQRVEAIVERQQSMPPKGVDHSFLFDREHRRGRVLRALSARRAPRSASASSRRSSGSSVAIRQRSLALFTILYCSTDRLCRCPSSRLQRHHAHRRRHASRACVGSAADCHP